ncbi:hypothetical protein [Aliidiomarina haloalkalitolerans]|uniref:Uncharacterized protein n=1 Tax=Aliidiomarina haloalkalitolerans TaxID=859059 RepID=A0A432VP75_9GAMM|nr:hypothetical protein [Aliidiomarina haloalkalitolerans]RUO17957.1 hypothetical protein CWE06_12380 [Aliidiomarina haloalkalitolerans]
MKGCLTRYPSNSGLVRLVVENMYQNGYFKGYRNHSTGVVIEQVTQVNAHGNGTRVQFQNGDIEHRFMVGGTVITHTEHGSGTTEQVTHLHKDAQGSTVVITGNAVLGNVLKQQIAYDP